MKDEINKQVLDTFCNVSLEFVGNVNSLHALGLKSKKLELAATKQICDIFNFRSHEVIYTGGRAEANNLAILGILQSRNLHNKKIVIFKDCSESIFDICNNIKNEFIIVDNYDDFTKLKYDEIFMVCFSKYEVGFALISIAKKFNFYLLYDCCDVVNSCNDFDFVSFDLKGLSPLLGIGFLAKKKNIIIEPIIHGGKSTTIYRSGTPTLALIVAFSKNIRLLYNLKKDGQTISG